MIDYINNVKNGFTKNTTTGVVLNNNAEEFQKLVEQRKKDKELVRLSKEIAKLKEEIQKIKTQIRGLLDEQSINTI